jgi:hypothetical protein
LGDRLAYVIVQNRRNHYRDGDSRIVYIGTTKNGMGRVATSAAAKAEEIFGSRTHGVKELQVHVIRCKGRQNVETWKVLERALLLTFKNMHGEVPKYNKQGRGRGFRARKEFDYFTKGNLESILQRIEAR